MLTSGEQRNALFGPAREQLKAAVEKFESLGNDKSTLGFSNARLAYDDVFARLLFFLDAENFGIKGTESLISERFRKKEPFSTRVIGRVNRGIELFSNARQNSQPYRFNKASVLSWLLFLSRFMEGSPPASDFMQEFITASQRKAANHFIYDAILVFEDRASLRVTDVSSVVYRDFSLCYAYYYLIEPKLPPSVPTAPIEEVESLLLERDDVSFEGALNLIVNTERWSATL